MRQAVAFVIALVFAGICAALGWFLGLWAVGAAIFGGLVYVAVVLSYILLELEGSRNERRARPTSHDAFGRLETRTLVSDRS